MPKGNPENDYDCIAQARRCRFHETDRTPPPGWPADVPYLVCTHTKRYMMPCRRLWPREVCRLLRH